MADPLRQHCESGDPLAIYDEMRSILKTTGLFDSNSRLAQLIDEAQWDAGILRAQREEAIAAATMDLRGRLAVREEQVKRLRRALHAQAASLGGLAHAAKAGAHASFDEVQRELREGL